MALVWEKIESVDDTPWNRPHIVSVRRAKVPGGWLVSAENNAGGGGLTFVPDPDHKWDGSSLP